MAPELVCNPLDIHLVTDLHAREVDIDRRVDRRAGAFLAAARLDRRVRHQVVHGEILDPSVELGEEVV